MTVLGHIAGGSIVTHHLIMSDIFTQLTERLRLHALKDYSLTELQTEIRSRCFIMAKQGYFSEYFDIDVNESEEHMGIASGRGWVILWDTNETAWSECYATAAHVINEVIGRIKFYQESKFACDENANAINHLGVARHLLDSTVTLTGGREHWVDADGNPAGGFSRGPGYLISWQRGPLGRVDTSERKAPNGAFVEDIINAVMSYLSHLMDIRLYKNPEIITAAFTSLKSAEVMLDSRTKRREEAKTEGTHEGN